MLYLCFMTQIGLTVDGKYTYEADFTDDVDSIWGENWNVCPASIIPNIKPEAGLIKKKISIDSEFKFETADKNNCFSMQDCIDGITPVGFGFTEDGEPFILRFGFTYDETIELLDEYGISYKEIEMDNTSDNIIDGLIDNLENEQ